jgi:protein associated with RNAse G/E
MNTATDLLTVKKLNLHRELVIAYEGTVLESTSQAIVLEARFSRETIDLGYTIFEHHDRFIEYFFTDRWYNIFEIHSVHNDHLKGWYCNIVQPAVFAEGTIEQVDFDALEIDRATRRRAQQAVGELIYLLYHHAAPFTSIDQPRAIVGE